MKYLNKIIKYAIVISVIVFLIERSMTTNGFLVGSKQLLFVFSIHFIYTFGITAINFIYFDFLDTIIPWQRNPKKRLIFGIIGALTLTMIAIVVLRIFTVMVMEQKGWIDFIKTPKSYYIFSIIIAVNVLITVHAIYFFKALTKKKVKEEQTISKTETAKFESLKNQLDPHFLFNSLNVLTSLIGENPKQAEKFTTKLSKVYRYVLQQKNQDLIEVKEELRFAKTYMDLLQIRFEDAIEFHNNTHIENEELKIVPLSLQLLLENAVKHNKITGENKLNITIFTKDHYLVIENNINPKNNLEKSTKVGLRNIIDRYALVSNKKVIIAKNDATFTVKLPLLTKKINKMETNYKKEEKYYRAKEKVKGMKEFYSSLTAYCILIPFLFFIWYRFTPHTIQWFWFPAFGWGIGLVFQYIKAFDKFPFMNKNWEEKKIKELMDKDTDFEDANNIKF